MVAQDKVEHWAFGFVLTLFAIAYPPMIFTGYAFGIVKEIDDYRTKGIFDLSDMLVTFIGAGMALVMLTFVGAFSWGMIF